MTWEPRNKTDDDDAKLSDDEDDEKEAVDKDDDEIKKDDKDGDASSKLFWRVFEPIGKDTRSVGTPFISSA